MNLISSEYDSFAKLRSQSFLLNHFWPLFINNESATVRLYPVRVEVNQICEKTWMLSVRSNFTINEWIAMSISVDLELASVVVMEILLFDLCNFESWWQLFIYSRS